MGNMGPFGNMIHQEENEYMYIIHAQMILESKCILTEISWLVGCIVVLRPR